MLQPVEEWLQGAAELPDKPPWVGDKPAGWFDNNGGGAAKTPAPAPPGQHSISEEDFALLEQFKRDRGNMVRTLDQQRLVQVAPLRYDNSFIKASVSLFLIFPFLRLMSLDFIVYFYIPRLLGCARRSLSKRRSGLLLGVKSEDRQARCKGSENQKSGGTLIRLV